MQSSTNNHSTVPSPPNSGEKVADRPDEGAFGPSWNAAYQPERASVRFSENCEPALGTK